MGTSNAVLELALVEGDGQRRVGREVLDSKWGVAQKNVDNLFSFARSNAPCIIFIDEARAASSGGHSGRRPCVPRHPPGLWLQSERGATPVALLSRVLSDH